MTEVKKTLRQTPSTDAQLRKLELEVKRIEKQTKLQELKSWRKMELDTAYQRVQIDKINALRNLLEATVTDDEKTKLGSESVYRNVFDESEAATIKAKIFKIIHNDL